MYPEVKTVDINELIPGCVNFRWREALWLPTWKIYCYPTEQQAQNIIRFGNKVLQPVRTRIGKPFDIHCWLRPEEYNLDPRIKGAKLSWHLTGGAVDFSVVTMKPSEVQAILSPWLGQYGARMETGTPTWTHLDDKPVKPGEPLIFKP